MNEKFNIQDIIIILAEKHGVDKKVADNFVKEFFILIEEGLEKDKYVKVRGLGTFKLIEVESRESVNVNSGERIEIKGHTKISFTPEPALKDIINRPFSHFESVVLHDGVVFNDMPSNEESEEVIQIDDNQGLIKSTDEEKTSSGEEETSLVAEIPQKMQQENIALQEECHNSPGTTTEVNTEFIESENKPKQFDKQHIDSGKRFISYFHCFIVVVMLLCLGSIFAMYWGDMKMISSFTNKNNSNVEKESVDSILLLQNDSLSSAKSICEPSEEDSISSVNSIHEVVSSETKPIESVVKNIEVSPKVNKKVLSAKSFIPDSTGYEIVGTETFYTIKEGETLTRVALKFYGTKAFWPYIVKHNSSVIENPNHVPFGTTIKIPKLKKKL